MTNTSINGQLRQKTGAVGKGSKVENISNNGEPAPEVLNSVTSLNPTVLTV